MSPDVDGEIAPVAGALASAGQRYSNLPVGESQCTTSWFGAGGVVDHGAGPPSGPVEPGGSEGSTGKRSPHSCACSLPDVESVDPLLNVWCWDSVPRFATSTAPVAAASAVRAAATPTSARRGRERRMGERESGRCTTSRVPSVRGADRSAGARFSRSIASRSSSWCRDRTPGVTCAIGRARATTFQSLSIVSPVMMLRSGSVWALV